jgi:phytoene dehydrogenase-like protein
MNAIVIGSGISGLIAACTLAQAGHRVTIFEQASQPGGVTASFDKAGFRWDMGQLLVEGFGPDEPAGQVLAGLGLAEAVRAVPNDRGYIFPDFELRRPAQFQDVRWRINLLKQLFPAEATGLERYWQDYLRFTRLMTFARRLEYASGADKLLLNLNLYATLLPFFLRKDWSAQRLMDSYFKDERLKLVFVSILADFFTPPSRFLGLGVFALNSEASFDKRSPKRLAANTEQIYQYSVLGGMRSVVGALITKINALGGHILTNRAVTKILVENNRVTGVRDQTGVITPAELVIASGGVQEVFLGLVGAQALPSAFAQAVQNVPLMDSVFMVHLGIDFDPSPYLHGVCTYVYGTYDIESAIAEARAGVYHEGRAGHVIHAPSLVSPEMAPAGMHALTIYTICPDRLAKSSWAARKEEFADKLVACAETQLPDLAAHTRVREIMTADDFRARTHLAHHAFGGIAPILGAWKAPHKSPVEGLWFVGAQSESGGGVSAVMVAAFKTALKAIELYF